MARPKIEITEELCKKAEALSAQGLTMEQIASVLGMSASSLYEKQKDNLELLESIKRGKDKGIATITNALFNSAKEGNLGAQIFYLKNRAGWKDKVETEHTGEGLKIDIKAPEHFQKIMEELDSLAEYKAKRASSKDDRILQ